MSPLPPDDRQPYKAVVVPPAPKASSAGAEAVFKANRRRDTAPEVALRRALHARGMRFLVDATPVGITKRRRIDVLLRGSRIAVLVHGCFWHCCPEHFVMPTANREWWTTKFRAIKHRDEDTLRLLEEAGWLPVVVWEHQSSDDAAGELLALHTARLSAR